MWRADDVIQCVENVLMPKKESEKQTPNNSFLVRNAVKRVAGSRKSTKRKENNRINIGGSERHLFLLFKKWIFQRDWFIWRTFTHRVNSDLDIYFTPPSKDVSIITYYYYSFWYELIYSDVPFSVHFSISNRIFDKCARQSLCAGMLPRHWSVFVYCTLLSSIHFSSPTFPLFGERIINWVWFDADQLLTCVLQITPLSLLIRAQCYRHCRLLEGIFRH